MAFVKVDDTDPRIQFSPDDLWKENDICFACDLTSQNKGDLQRDAFNATWRAAPAAKFSVKNMTITFSFSGSNVAATFILFRRTDNKGRTHAGGQSSLSLLIDDNVPQIIPLTLDSWSNQELQQQYRFVKFNVPSVAQGNRTLSLVYVRDDALDVPVTLALDSIQFTSPFDVGGDDSKPATIVSGIEPTITLSSEEPGGNPTPSSSSSGTPPSSSDSSQVAKILGPMAAILITFAILLVFLCRRKKRRTMKRKYLKANMRAFQPVVFDPYYKSSTYDLDHQDNFRRVVKQPPTFFSFSKHISQTSTLDSDTTTVEPASPASSTDEFTDRRRNSIRTSTSASLYPNDHRKRWKLLVSKSSVSIDRQCQPTNT